MARPVNADADATRQRIVESALTLFAERGAGASPIREIAGRAGVSLAMVHHYFGNKDGLYAACVDAMYEDLASLRDRVAGDFADGRSDDLEALVDRVVRTCFRFARDHQPAVRLLLRSVVEAGELDAERREGFQLPFLSQASALLAGAGGRPAEALRPAVQSIVFLIARYAISTERELALVAGTTPGTALPSIEDHLVDVAQRLLGFT